MGYGGGVLIVVYGSGIAYGGDVWWWCIDGGGIWWWCMVVVY